MRPKPLTSAEHVFTRVRIPGEREVDLARVVAATGIAALVGTAGGRVKRLIVAITRQRRIYGVRLLQLLRAVPEVETPRAVPGRRADRRTGAGHDTRRPEALADVVHNPRDIGASVASGSFVTDGMVVAPCSMNAGQHRARRPTTSAAPTWCSRSGAAGAAGAETPLNQAHLRNMLAVTEMGGVICPPVPRSTSAAVARRRRRPHLRARARPVRMPTVRPPFPSPCVAGRGWPRLAA